MLAKAVIRQDSVGSLQCQRRSPLVSYPGSHALVVVCIKFRNVAVQVFLVAMLIEQHTRSGTVTS